MDIRDLPDVFLRKLMRTLSIKDRLKLRLTCRAFEKLVAKSNAGYFDTGILMPALQRERRTTVSAIFGDAILRNIEGHDNCLRLRQRLLRGASFGKFVFSLADVDFTLAFLREYMQHFSVSKLCIIVESQRQFDNAVQLIADFSNCEHELEINGVLPAAEQLLELPPLEQLEISNRLNNRNCGEHMKLEISPILFFDLLDNQLNLTLDEVRLEANDLKSALEIISDDDRDRSVKLWETSETIVKWLERFGFTEYSEEGAICAGIEILQKSTGVRGDWCLRYLNCTVSIELFLWGGIHHTAPLTITNKKEL